LLLLANTIRLLLLLFWLCILSPLLCWLHAIVRLLQWLLLLLLIGKVHAAVQKWVHRLAIGAVHHMA
jgi:hypothetical protein